MPVKEFIVTGKRRLVIVESPTKATKIASYLGDGYVVESSRGHVRDLPNNAAEVPTKYKGQPWSRLGVNIEEGFSPLYVVNPEKRSTIKKLKDELKDVDELFLATDEDREGEAIAWHLLQELKPKVPVKRMVFHEITQEAIRAAVENPRELDQDLVDAQETRRILDRLYGYEVSPVLWKKVMPKLSAGRVQSVATRLVVDRERKRIAFVPAEYWDLNIKLDAGADADVRQFPARLANLDGTRIARGNDFDDAGKLTSGVFALTEKDATGIAEALKKADISVADIENKPYRRRPAAPFRTTTLQQEAGRKLGFSTDRTMRVAQQLYESGFITYMRTDSVSLSGEAINAARDQAVQLYGSQYVPEKPRFYSSKVKNAQEAHEAIRPAGSNFRTPAQAGLAADQFRLYELIWQRTIASQMADAEGQTVSVKIDAKLDGQVALSSEAKVGVAGLVASGRTITFPGFMKAYVEAEGEKKETRLPQLNVAQDLGLVSAEADGHQTKPPARYTEPSLIAKLEELEIGRPSTYASIIRTITARDYVWKRGSALVPTWLAFAVTRLMEEHFPQLVDYKFTADLEDRLDEIANGNLDRLEVLHKFYNGDGGNQGLAVLVEDLEDIDARANSTFPIGEDSGIVLRVGRYGPYLEDAKQDRANVPEDLAPDELTLEKAKELLVTPSGAERELGLDPEKNVPIVVRNGRYGPYVTEIIEAEEGKKKPKARTASLFKTMSPNTVTLEEALKLLSLPRLVGKDAEGVEITAQNGPYGPYLRKGKDTRQLPSEEALFTVTLEEAEELYSKPKTRGARSSALLRELGEDKSTGKKMVIKNGRFGPYITDGETNQSLPKTLLPEDVTPEQASDMLAAKRAKGPAPKRRGTVKKSTAKKTTAKKTTAKKSTSKTTKKS